MSTQTIYTHDDHLVRIEYDMHTSGDGWNQPRDYDLELGTITVDGKTVTWEIVLGILARHFGCERYRAQDALVNHLSTNHEHTDVCDPDTDGFLDAM